MTDKNKFTLKFITVIVTACMILAILPLSSFADTGTVKYGYLTSAQFFSDGFSGNLSDATDIQFSNDESLDTILAKENLIMLVVYSTGSEPANVTLNCTNIPVIIASNVNVTAGENGIGQLYYVLVATKNGKFISTGNVLYSQLSSRPLVGTDGSGLFSVQSGGSVSLNNGSAFDDLSANFTSADIINIFSNMSTDTYIDVSGNVDFAYYNGDLNFDSSVHLNINGVLNYDVSYTMNNNLNINAGGQLVVYNSVNSVECGINGSCVNNGIITGGSGSVITFGSYASYSGTACFYTNDGLLNVAASNLNGHSFAWNTTDAKWECTDNTVPGVAALPKFSASFDSGSVSLSYSVNGGASASLNSAEEISFNSGDSVTLTFTPKNAYQLSYIKIDNGAEILPSAMTALTNRAYSYTLTNCTAGFGVAVTCDFYAANLIWNTVTQNANTLADFTTAYATSGNYIKVFDSTGTEVTSQTAVIGTGYTLKRFQTGDNALLNYYTVIVSGDNNGDGLINATDISKVMNVSAGSDTITSGTCYFTASDINGDGVIDAFDAAKIDLLSNGYYNQ